MTGSLTCPTWKAHSGERCMPSKSESFARQANEIISEMTKSAGGNDIFQPSPLESWRQNCLSPLWQFFVSPDRK